MDSKNLVFEKFQKFPYALEMGAKKLSKWWDIDENEIRNAKKVIRGGITNNIKSTKLPKILIFDIETSPSIVYSFDRFKANIGLDQVIQDPVILTWSAKWLYSGEVIYDSISVEEIKKFDDKRIVQSLWNLLNECDIAVAHFGDKFDIPTLNSRAIINGLPPYSSITTIDTKMVASRSFRFPSNKLDALGTYFGVGNKIHTDFLLWRGCLEGNQEKIDEMTKYNIQDVVLLEEVYLKLRPWIKAHPNIALYVDSENPVCSHCGSENIKKTGNFYYTQAGKYPEYRCSCGALTRGRFNEFTKDNRKNLLISTGK